MNISQAKQISLVIFLAKLGYQPTKQAGINLWYCSPLRTESKPSFKLNTSRNLWYDFGLGKGGTIIELAQELSETDRVADALCLIEQTVNQLSDKSAHFSFRPQSSLKPNAPSVSISPLDSPMLLNYLRQRGIKGRAYPRLYQAKMSTRGKEYMSLAFQNDEGGYELRNKYYKGCTSKAITSIIQDYHKPTYVLEGFMDYLSLVDSANMHQEQSKPLMAQSNFVVLNSLAMLRKAVELLKPFGDIRLMLDNDDSGSSATAILKNQLHWAVDCSAFYSQCKDVNQFLAKANDNEAVDFISRCVNVSTETKVSAANDHPAFTPVGRKRESTHRFQQPSVCTKEQPRVKAPQAKSSKKGGGLCR